MYSRKTTPEFPFNLLMDSITSYVPSIQDVPSSDVDKLCSTDDTTSSQSLSGNLAGMNTEEISTLSQVFSFLDNIACAWLNLVNMNIFAGFSTEDELEYYFLNRQFQDNFTVVAGLVFENFNYHMDTLPSHVL
ncbi:ATP-binding cassette sub-family A member 2-like isoform X2 [Ruditapes philippinarum]|uniref:ATP-binding cassette sub-family A member 2-like isoform X2 n=1 Tax=Ruditapes philippinarum TaxID=129788 RepID=UPI00295AA20D|nr:ATP-binding cassette sub-family A member 2-like isoform X2 [Ruditapes philippinarum]